MKRELNLAQVIELKEEIKIPMEDIITKDSIFSFSSGHSIQHKPEKDTLIDPSEIPLHLFEKQSADLPYFQTKKNLNQTSFLKSKKERLDRQKPEDSKVGKYLGGLFGILLALIAFPVLFLVVVVGFQHSEKKPFNFELADKDSPFRKAFKNCFNTVFNMGILIMKIIGVLAILAGLSLLLFEEVGLVGVLIIIGLILLIIFIIFIIFKIIFEIIGELFG